MKMTELFACNPYLSRYMAMTQESEVPELYRIWSGISSIAASLERRVWLDWEVRYFPNLFICLIGPPAARKGTAMKPMSSLLRRIGINFAPSSVPTETLIHKLAHTSDWFQSPDTGEIINHASMFIYAPELTNFTGVKESLRLSVFCELYDALERFEYLTHKHGEICIENVCLNMLGATTPRNLQEHMPHEAIGGGFTSRFIFVYGEQPPFRVSDVPTKEQLDRRNALADELTRYLSMYRDLTGAFTITPEFAKLYKDWRDESAEYPPTPAYDPKLIDYMGRREAHLRKIAMSISVGRSPELVLRSIDFHLTRELLELTEKTMPRAMRDIGATPDQKIIASIHRQIVAKSTGATFEELMQRHIGLVNVDMMAKMLQGLEVCKYIKAVNAKGIIRYVVGDVDMYDIQGGQR